MAVPESIKTQNATSAANEVLPRPHAIFAVDKMILCVMHWTNRGARSSVER